MKQTASSSALRFLQRRHIGFSLLVALFCSLAPQVTLALQFDVFLGLDGIVSEGAWFPVVCEIKNDGPPFTGTVEVTPGNMGNGATYRLPIELPTGTLKRVTIPVFSSARGFSAWDVLLRDSRGKIRAGQNNVTARTQTSAGNVILGALSRTPGGTPSFPPPHQSQDPRHPAVARLMPAIFPDNPLVLEGLTALYLNTERAADLTLPQIQALLAWLHGGGHLIVGLEQPGDITSSPWLDHILPFGVEKLGESTAPHEVYVFSREYLDSGDDQSFTKSTLQVGLGQLREGSVLVRAGDQPLIVQATRGRGVVTLLLFSPEREPVRSWKRLPAFWARLSGVPERTYSTNQPPQVGYSGWGSDGIFGAMLDSRQVHKLPVEWLLLLLCLYLVVIGPVDYFWLKRIRRQMLTWITFPSYVAGFSLLIYVIGYSLRAGDSELNQIHVVDVLSRAGQAELRGRSFTSIYAPANENHILSGTQEFAVFRDEMETAWGSRQGGDRFVVDQTGSGYRARVSVPVWSSVLFVSDWWQSAPLPLRLEATRDAVGWRCVIENRTGQALTHVRFVAEGLIFSVDDVPAGATKEFRPSGAGPIQISTFLNSRISAFQSAVQSRQYAFGGEGSGRLGDLPDSSLAASLLGFQRGGTEAPSSFVVSPGLDVSATLQRGTPILFAWAESAPPVPPRHDYTPVRSKSYILWRCSPTTP